MGLYCLLASFVATLHLCSAQFDVLYSGCNLEDYYADLLSSSGSLREDVTRQELESLLKSTHRKVLPYTGSNNRDDVWRALIDLDTGDDDPDSVRLIYRQEDSPAWPHGTAKTWNREHLWPKSRGVEYTGADFTDVHHLRPADWNVNAARSNLYFGECGIAEAQAECEIPAHGEAALDTASDSTIFLPPQRVRGDIARAIFYTDVRYSSPPDDNLIVTDCPKDDDPFAMAYKSALLEWHIQDEVTDAERQRNQRACERWQGNRNPFVDFPELVKRLFGNPQTPLGDGLGYPCDGSTVNPAPAPVPTPSLPTNDMPSCKDLEAGDVMFVAVNSDQPDLVALVALKDLQEGLFLYLTDNAYTGSDFRTNEGTIMLHIPSPGIKAGAVFGYGDSNNLLHSKNWESVLGQFQLSSSGDAILLYCQDDPETKTPMRFLSGLDYSGEGWMEANLPPEEYGTSQSALPGKLKGATVAVPHLDNYRYTGSTSAGSLAELQALLSDPNQWQGSNTVAALPSVPTSFSLPSTSGGPSPGDVMVVAMNSENPDMVALVALDNLPGGLELYMTDNAWTGSDFQTNEGTVQLTLPSNGINAGTIFGYGPNLLHGDDWTSMGGKFALAQNGDAIFVYTKNENGQVHHLCAFSYNGGWKKADTEDFSSDESALPESLRSVGSLSLPHKDNYAYIGSFSGDKASLQAELQKEANWRGSNTDPVDAPTTRFSLSSTSSGGSSVGSSYWHFQLLALSLLKSFVG